MAKLTNNERMVTRFFQKKGVDLSYHTVINGIFFEGDDNRVIGFTSAPPEEIDTEKPLEHPGHPGVFFKIEGTSPIFTEPNCGVGEVGFLTPSEALDLQGILFVDPYNILDMLERAEVAGMTEIDPCCLMYFIHKEEDDSDNK